MNKILSVFVLVFLVGASSAFGQSGDQTKRKSGSSAFVASSPKNQNSSKVRNAKSLETITPKRKKELIGFVMEHHPELKKLLQTLEKRRPEKYRTAMRSLSQSYDRLVSLEKEPKKYRAALDNWKLKSRVDLLAARIALKDNPDQRKQLQKLISDNVDNRVTQLLAERKRMEQRLQRIDQQLAKLSENREKEVERQVDVAIRKIRNAMGLGNKKGAQRKAAPKDPSK